MRKLLPAFLKKIFPFLLLFILFFLFSKAAFAQTQTPDTSGVWVPDSEVTFVGKAGARAGSFLDWALADYKWTTGSANLSNFWIIIRNIVYALCLLFVLGTAFAMIITRGKSVTLKQFIPRFIFIVFLVTFSFALVQFFYQITDIIQGFFLKNSSGALISQKDLLYIGFDYKDFSGLKRLGSEFEESAFISLLLVKITAVTYYVMVGTLIIRKIILWFFIAISPLFPLLLLYYPLRNTGKIWLGEFFRWLLYAPLFAIFLSGLVSLWAASSPKTPGIPLDFSHIQDPGIIYPTAINILLGGPGQLLSLNNSVNINDTFALYVVSLLMLWVVILLPWILLKIFLDYFKTLSFADNNLVKQMISQGSGLFVKNSVPPVPPPKPLTPSFHPTGIAKSLPFADKTYKTVSKMFEASEPMSLSTSNFSQTNSEILRLTDLLIPTIRDIVRLETSSLSSDIGKHQDVARVHEILERISNPNSINVPMERERYSKVKEKLLQEKQNGNPLAASILSAAQNVTKTTTSEENVEFEEVLRKIARPETLQNVQDIQVFRGIKEKLLQEKQNGNPLATSVLSAVASIEEEDSVSAMRDVLRVNEVLKKISNPQILEESERQKYTRIKEDLEREGLSGNPLATTILRAASESASGNISLKKLEELKNQIIQEQKNPLISSVISSLNTVTSQDSIIELYKVLEKIAYPEKVPSSEKEVYTNMRETLGKEREKGNPLASITLTVINNIGEINIPSLGKIQNEILERKVKGDPLAGKIFSAEENVLKRSSQKEVEGVKEKLNEARKKADPLASTILSAMLKSTPSMDFGKSNASLFPVANRVQSVNIDDYETVKKMWQENYLKLDVPRKPLATEKDREDWIRQDIEKINRTISLLTSSDNQKIKEGMKAVSQILPFLLIGGFSQTEVLAYLKAKMEAGKSVLSDLEKNQEEEDTMILTGKKEGKPKEMTMEAQDEKTVLDDPNEKKDNDVRS
ncbi:MAG: hypothetical protein M1450_00800 [Patescibacteria group bacterium]|nr:hypothetical protein [Patescibacteria group bacterium]